MSDTPITELIRERQADLRERFALTYDAIERGDATHFALDALLDELDWLMALAREVMTGLAVEVDGA